MKGRSTKLNDYGGEFLPKIKLSDFSPDVLVELLIVYSKLYIALDGFWYLAVKEKAGNEEALACDMWVWERFCKYEMKKITKLLNIKGNDVITFMKAMQIVPYTQSQEYKIEVLGNHCATLTITHCPTLEALEKEGEGRENEICNLVEPKVFKFLASFFNSKIEVKKLKSPPRESKEDICCQWQFIMEGE